MAFLLFLFALLGWAGPAQATTLYLNSAETGCDGTDATVIFCEDFGNGEWAETDAECKQHTVGTATVFQVANCLNAGGAQFYLPNKGWFNSIFHSADPACLTNNCGYPTASSVSADQFYAHCNGAGPIAGATGGPAGFSCYGRSGISFSSGETDMLGPATHNFGPSTMTAYNNVAARLYMRFSDGTGASTASFTWADTKMFTIQHDFTADAGIQMGHFGCNKGGGSAIGFCQPVWCESDNAFCLSQNLGVNLSMVPGRWYAIQFNLIPNSTSGSTDATVEMWIDDCGASGASCSGTPTKRMAYTNANMWNVAQCPTCSSGNHAIGSINWELAYQNAPNWTVGQEFYIAGLKVINGATGIVPIAFPSGGGGGGAPGPGQSSHRGRSRLRTNYEGDAYESFRDQFARDLVQFISLGR